MFLVMGLCGTDASLAECTGQPEKVESEMNGLEKLKVAGMSQREFQNWNSGDNQMKNFQ